MNGPSYRKSDLVITPKVVNMFKISETLPEDYDEKMRIGSIYMRSTNEKGIY